MNKDNLEKLQNFINESNHIVVFSGAGVSTESGIKDFRSKDGLYNEVYKYPPETILSHSFFTHNTNDFYEFYRDKMDCRDALPNSAHKFFAMLEVKNKLECIITQNIDNLHTLAGNKKVIELHGSIFRNYCMKCNKFYNADFIFDSDAIPKCDCGGTIKPDVVLYEEALDDDNINEAINSIRKADMLIIVGTSLSVYPASGFVNFFKGKYLVIINKDTTHMDSVANLVINDRVAKVFEKINI